VDLQRILTCRYERETKEKKMKDFRYLEDVSTLVLDEDRCIGCGLCTEVCPHAVFEMSRNRAKIVDFNACMECGACVNNCPADAISVNPGVG
jgi:NAD-dependent dihydropyrimidine dehydrogenase PreA subunit